MLKSLSLKNFRGFSDHRIDFSPETILIGQNNAGKTTVIEALRTLSVAQSRITTAIFTTPPEWLNGVCQGAGYKISLDTIDFDFTNVHHAYDTSSPASIKAKLRNNSEVCVYIGSNSDQVFCQLKPSAAKLIHSRSEIGGRSFGNVRVMPPVGSLLAHEKIITKERLNRFLDGYLAYRHFRNQLWDRPSHYRLFKKLLDDTWHGLTIQHFENDHGTGGNELSLLVREGRFTSEISWHGHGLQAWMQTIWFLARTPKLSTIVLDEPDVYLHADLQRKLIKVIENLGFAQAIMATHSSEIIGDVPFQNVTVIKKQERVSKPADKANEIQRALKGMGSLHSIQLSKIAQRGLILFVEGDDKVFLSDVAYKMGGKLFDEFSTIAVQELKGKGNANSAMGTAKALSEASSGELRTILLVDNDYMTPEQRATLQKKANISSLILKIWKKKEIENYFINIETIHRYICNRMEDLHPSIDDIDMIVSQIILNMKTDLILSIADVIQKSTRPQIEPKTAYKRAEQMIEAKLSTGYNYTDLVDGKDFISQLSAVSQQKFGVSISPLGLCKEMRLNEYDIEMRDFISALCSADSLPTDAFSATPDHEQIAA